MTMVFGGSFNPAHTGHVQAVKDAVGFMRSQGYNVAHVVVAPTADKLLNAKLGDKAYPLADRTEMARLTFQNEPGVTVSSKPAEAAEKQEGKLRRTQLADWAQGEHPGTTVVNVTGQDAAPGHPPAPLSVYSGDAGTSHEGYFYLSVPREENTPASKSSTKIRAAIKEGNAVPAGMMHPDAEKYLHEMLRTNAAIQKSTFWEDCAMSETAVTLRLAIKQDTAAGTGVTMHDVPLLVRIDATSGDILTARINPVVVDFWIVAKGNVAGHEFHGNQWTASGGGAVVSDAKPVASHETAGTAEAAGKSLMAGESVTLNGSDLPALLDYMKSQDTIGNLVNCHIAGKQLFDGSQYQLTRDQMPQIPNKFRDQFVAEMEAKGVTFSSSRVAPDSLKPVQVEISANKSGVLLDLMREGKLLGDNDRLVVSQDGYVADGHHRWAAAVGYACEKSGVDIPILKVGLPLKELLGEMGEFNQRESIAAKPITMKEFTNSQLLDDQDLWVKGDVVGHEFHGNQWTGGGATAAHHQPGNVHVPEAVHQKIKDTPLANPQQAAGHAPTREGVRRALDTAAMRADFSEHGAKVVTVAMSSLKAKDPSRLEATPALSESHRKGESTDPVVINEKGVILHGHESVAAAIAAGRENIVAVRVKGNDDTGVAIRRMMEHEPVLSKVEIERRYPVANAAGLDTQQKYKGDGTKEGMKGEAYTSERAALHERMIAETVRQSDNPTPVEKPLVLMMGGGTASGKSVAINSGRVKLPENSLKIDSDALKAKLPEYKTAIAAKDISAAGHCHEESSDVAKALAAKACQEHLNFVLDGTGDNSVETLRTKVEAFKAAGLRVEAAYMTVDTDRALAWAKKRAEETGRHVDEKVLRLIHASVSRVLPEAVRQGFFDKVTLWDNNSGVAVKVMTAEGSALTVHDPVLWQRFLDKGKE